MTFPIPRIKLRVLATSAVITVAMIALFLTFYMPGFAATAKWGDCSQKLFIANEGNGGDGTTVRMARCGGGSRVFATSVGGPSGLATDGTHLYMSDNDGVYRFDGFANNITISTAFDNPNALAVDSSGRLLVSDANGGELRRLTIDVLGNVTLDEQLADFSGFSNLQGVVEIPGAGDVLFTDNIGLIYKITTTMALPVTPTTAGLALPVGVVVSGGNIGHLALDSSDNVYVNDFSNTVARVNASGTIAKDVVSISEAPACNIEQSVITADEPAFRGMAISPDGDLVVTGYCLDNVYIFLEADLQTAWDTDTPITTLPTPFLDNRGTGLDGRFNGTYGVVFWDRNHP